MRISRRPSDVKYPVPKLGPTGLPLGQGRWPRAEFLRYSMIPPSRLGYGCGDIMCIRAGLRHPMQIYDAMDAKAFGFSARCL